MKDTTRRELLSGVGGAAAVGLLLGAGDAARGESHERPKRTVVAGNVGWPFSRATAYGGIVFVSGVLGRPASGEMPATFEEQARQAMENLKASVEAAGATMADVLKCQAFLTEQSDFATFNNVYKTYFPNDPPARSTVIVKALVVPDAKIEIDCFACTG